MGNKRLYEYINTHLRVDGGIQYDDGAGGFIDIDLVLGTYKIVADIIARDAIPALKRMEGLRCFVLSEATDYRLEGGIDNINWTTIDNTEITRDIYISITGNDITGDGTVGLPFATINRALSDIKKNLYNITVSLMFEAGSYNFTNADRALIATLTMYNSTLEFKCVSRTLENSGFTLAVRAGEALRYDVSAAGQTWTENQYRDMFITDGSGTFWPITHNSAGSDNMEIDFVHHSKAGCTEIYSLNVTLINSDSNGQFLDTPVLSANGSTVSFEGIIFDATAVLNKLYYANANTLFKGCLFDMNFLLLNGKGQYYFNEVSIRGTQNNGTWGMLWDQSDMGIVNEYNRIYVRNNGTSPIVHVKWTNSMFFDLVAEGSGGVICTGRNWYARRVTKIVGAINAFAPIYIDGKITSNEGAILMLYDCTNILNITDKKGISIVFDNYWENAPTALYAPGNRIELVNPSKGLRIQWPGLYPEMENPDPYTLPNGLSENIIVGDTLQNKAIFIKYTISRDGDIETGTLVLTNKSDTYINRQGTSNDDAGIVFTKNINGTEIRLGWQDVLALGSDSQLELSINRQMK